MFTMVLRSLLVKFYRVCGCTTAYNSFNHYRKRAISFETFFGRYVTIWESRFPPGLDCIWCLRNVIAFIDTMRTIARRIRTYWQLCHCKLQRRFPWLMVNHQIDPSIIARECFIYQNRDLRLVVEILQEVVAQGVFLIAFHRAFSVRSSVDPGTEFFNSVMGRLTYEWNSYFYRVATEMRATIGGERIFVALDRDAFSSEETYPEYCQDKIIRKGKIREAARTAVYILQHLPSLANPVNAPDYAALQEDIQNANAAQPQLALLNNMLYNWKFSFRYIADPYITREEIMDSLHSYGIERPLAEMYCFAFSELCSEISASDLTPRSLYHLSRCRIRKTLFENWRYPEDILKLNISELQQNYLTLCLP